MIAAGGGAENAVPSIIPRPAQMEVSDGEFSVTESTSLFVEPGDPELRWVGEYLAERLNAGSGYEFDVTEPAGTEAPKNAIVLMTSGADPALGDEGYELTVEPERVLLRAPKPQGVFRGVQTIRQLLPTDFEGPRTSSAKRPSWAIPCVSIKDKPRYRWRGSLLDCCRHFMTKEFVKRYIDLLAYHKMNVLHWHLTEDQGWRIEIDKYPKLTDVGAWRREADERYGGFYTKDEIREVVAYAQSRYVTVVPEIEMPGHCRAALASYPEVSCTGGPFEVAALWGVYDDVYCAGNDETFHFLEVVLTEVLELFPSEFIHIGGDECPKTRWQECPKCQGRIKAEGLKDEHELQSYFIRRIERFLNGKGRRLVGWDEILEGGLAPNATVQSWRGMSGAIAAAKAGHDVVASPTSHCYLDYSYDAISLERIYSFEPTPPELTPDEAKHILGAEGNIWTERAPQDRVDHQVWPRLCALAEVTWSPKDLRGWDDFSQRMKRHYQRLDAFGVTYHIALPQIASPHTVFTDTVDVVLSNPVGRGVIRYTLDGSDPTQDSPEYTDPISIRQTTTIKAQAFLDTGNASDPVEFRFTKQQPREPLELADGVPGLSYEYYEGSWDRLPDFDQLTPAETGTVETFDLSVRKRDDYFAVRFAAYVEVPTDGIYTFYVSSDDGSRLWIGSDLVVDNDGLHGARERSGQIILRAGLHPIRVEHFEAGGAERLEVNYEGPGIPKGPVPSSDLLHRHTSE